MTKPNAQVKMKALVAARLLMGDFDNWKAFEQEREIALKIANRRIARSVSAQIGRSYRDLSGETQKFMSENFARCDYVDLAKLCEAIPLGLGIYLRHDDFEASFFPLAERIKRRVPFYAHVSISTYGLQFEFPEYHFLRDLESALNGLAETRSRIADFSEVLPAPKKLRDEVRNLVARDSFLNRSIISAAFNLVEAFLSGVFYTAIHTGLFGCLTCDDDFLKYAQKKESAPLKKRLDRVVSFASQGQATGDDDPFKSFIEFGKHYRDAIHHTTPFERRGVEAGGRLLALYGINNDVALRIALISLDTVLSISRWAYGDCEATDIGAYCGRLKRKANDLLRAPAGSERV